MGGKDPNRQPQLASLRVAPVGWVRMANAPNAATWALFQSIG